MALGKQVMSWWSKYKKAWLILASSFALICLAIIALRLVGPRLGEDFCTLVGCLGGIQIIVEGLPDATVYELDIRNLHGMKQSITCKVGVDEFQILGDSCVPNGAAFTLNQDEVPPEEITVTITVEEKKFTKVFRPVYDKFRPNGEDCPPVCYSAIITMKLSQ